MRILICDDDVLITKQLHKYLQEYFAKNNLKLPETAVYHNGEALLKDDGAKDIVFLDIEMCGLNGIHVGNELKKINTDTIVFIITSYPDYLDEAVRFHAFRYLSKPIDKQRLFGNLKDALKSYHTYSAAIAIETKEKVYTVSASDIIYVEAIGRRVTVHTISKSFTSTQNMQYWSNVLRGNCFFQPHRSYIVNMEYVSEFDHSLIDLYNGNFKAYLTRRKYTEFKDAYLLYLESMR